MAEAQTSLSADRVQEARPWRTAALFLLTLAGVAVCVGLVHSLLFPLTAAVALAVILRTPQLWLRARMPSSFAASTLLLLLCLAVLLPGFFIVRSLVGEVTQTIHYVQSGDANRDFHSLTAKHEKIGRNLQQAADQLTPDQAGKRVAGQAAVWFGRGLQGFVSGITQICLALFFLFFLLRDGDAARQLTASLVPLQAEDTDKLLSRLSDLIYAVVAGRFVIAALQGTLAGVAYWLLGVPGSLLWGVLTALLCLVPAFGAFIAWIPVAIYLGLAGSWTKALILSLWGGLVVSNVDNVLYPMLVGRRTSLHTAVIFVAIFGGVALLGLSGFVLGPVAVAAAMLLLQAWKTRLGTETGKTALP